MKLFIGLTFLTLITSCSSQIKIQSQDQIAEEKIIKTREFEDLMAIIGKDQNVIDERGYIISTEGIYNNTRRSGKL